MTTAQAQQYLEAARATATGREAMQRLGLSFPVQDAPAAAEALRAELARRYPVPFGVAR